jgi:hypothetical protein
MTSIDETCFTQLRLFISAVQHSLQVQKVSFLGFCVQQNLCHCGTAPALIHTIIERFEILTNMNAGSNNILCLIFV